MPKSLLLIDCIDEWLKDNYNIVTGYEIKEHIIDKFKYEIFRSGKSHKSGIIILNRSIYDQMGQMFIWSMSENFYVDTLIAIVHVNNDVVEFECNEPANIRIPLKLSNIMSSANPLFFDWMRDWLKIVIYGMDTIRKT